MSKSTTYAIAALIASLAIATFVLAVVASPLVFADEKCNPNGFSTGNPHDNGDTGNPHDNGDTGNPHDRCHVHR